MQRNFKDHFIASAVAIVMGGGAGVGTMYATKQPDKIVIQQLPPQSPKELTRGDLRRFAQKWPELPQADVDAITRIMVSTPKQNVFIFCEDTSRCGDLALDLENAFESARWNVKVERPLFNMNEGFCVTDEGMAVVLRKVFGDRIPVKVIQSSLPENTVGIVLGKRI